MSLINPGGSPGNTFSSGVYTDDVFERTVGHGVSVGGMLVKNGIPNTAAATPTLVNDGDLAYDSNTKNLKVRTSGSTKNVAVNNTPGVKGAIGGPPPVYKDSNTITLKAGLRAQDSASFNGIEVTADLDVSLGITGAGGLDTGTEATNTWYYLYLIRKSTSFQVSAVFSLVNESVTGSITTPSGYDQKRQLPFAVRNDGSSNIIPFFVGHGWPYRPKIYYRTAFASASNANPTNILYNGTATSFTTISAALFIPPISRFAEFNSSGVGTGNFNIGETGLNTHFKNITISNTGGDGTGVEMVVNASGQIDYFRASVGACIDVRAFVVTEIL